MITRFRKRILIILVCAAVYAMLYGIFRVAGFIVYLPHAVGISDDGTVVEGPGIVMHAQRFEGSDGEMSTATPASIMLDVLFLPLCKAEGIIRRALIVGTQKTT